MKMSDIGYLQIKPNRTDLKIQKPKIGFRGSIFKKPTSAVWGRFFTLSHSQFILQHMTGSTVKVFVFMSYLCTSSSESFWLTVSWTSDKTVYWKALSRVHAH